MSQTSLAQWHLYVLRCADGSFYAGITTDLERRLNEHNSSPKGARYTRARRPVALVKAWGMLDRSAATKAELAFKRLSRSQKVALIDGQWYPDWLLSS